MLAFVSHFSREYVEYDLPFYIMTFTVLVPILLLKS